MSNLKHITELALIRSIPDLMVGKPKKNSRLNNLMNTLQDAVDEDLVKVYRLPGASDLMKIQSILENFKTVANFGKQKHIGTIVSFCLVIIEDSEEEFNDKIIRILNLIIDYYERVGDLHVASMWSADLALARWKSIFNN